MITLLEYAKIADEAVPRQAYQAIAITGLRFVTFNAPGMWTNAIGVCAFKRLTNTLQRGMNMIKWGDPVGDFGKHIGDTTRVRSVGHSIVGFIEFLKRSEEHTSELQSL